MDGIVGCRKHNNQPKLRVMNKTVSINLGGFSFHIDEDAYQKLSRYFDAIKRSLSPDGRDEIMNDIEARIAEIFQAKLSSGKEVILDKDVEDMIEIKCFDTYVKKKRHPLVSPKKVRSAITNKTRDLVRN